MKKLSPGRVSRLPRVTQSDNGRPGLSGTTGMFINVSAVDSA